MTLDNWQALGSVLAVCLIGAYNAVQARRANKQTQSTGNGFARHVKESLVEIRAEQRRQRDLLVGHIADHAESDLRRNR